MKVITLLLAAACLAHATQVPTQTADKTYLLKQKSIYELFWHVDQPTVYHPELYQKARSFSLEDNVASFTDQAAVTEFLQRWKHGMLPRGEMFSETHPQHYQEAVCFFRVLYSAKDFDTFYNTAVWARFHMNERMYLYVLSVAVMHRPDTNNILLPPIYEVFPHDFFNEDILHKAYRIAMGDSLKIELKFRILLKCFFPMSLLLSRLNQISLHETIYTYIHIAIKIKLHINIKIAIQDVHTRIFDAIDKGYVVDTHGKHIDIYTVDGFNYLGNVIQGNADSANPVYYGQLERLYRKVLGIGPVQVTRHTVVPTALELFSTTLRDPVFYGIQKNIATYWMRYKEHLPSYTHEELIFPGVTIESVTVDKLLTFFDHFESMLNNAVSIRSHKEAQSLLIKARQYRLNHKPFTYHITINSNKNVKAVVRVFLGPKHDVHGHELDMSENYMNFIEMDQWNVDLKSGTNKIERNSYESIYVVPDEVPSEVLYKKVVKAIEGGETFTYPGQIYGFPDRLILPKGKKEGMLFKLFVCVSHFDETKATKVDSLIWGPRIMDLRPLGYPLDRPIHTFNFSVPNFHMRDVLIFHKQAEELNLTA
ncbi:Hexamerin [Cyphomyrmex costatus]|uniref:Hexamerin n=1 Tax=Cyphomyrmex costatus TaxID=456900 RepID=A0A195CKX2_9HYME|nr:Hexamerin [Cyphomyrmex costatus]